MTKKQVTKWYLTINKDGKTIHRRAMTDYSRLAPWLQAKLTAQLKSKPTSQLTFYVKADYGKHLDNFGDMVTFENEGEYTSYKEAKLAMCAFAEVAREWDEEVK